MDFGMLPPEINSGRMYSGAGAGPMLTAALAWDELAAELHSIATSYQSVISGVIGATWRGPTSTTMAAAAAPYMTWMSATAAQAEQAGAQAKAAAGAYETAWAMTVPPPLIAANRALLMALWATNILGQNSPAIAATEAQYGEMWAQDAAAMYGYAGSSAAASTLTPFTPPPQTTNPAGLAGQTAAIAQAAGTSAGTNAESIMATGPQLISTMPQALQELTSPSSTTPSVSSLTSYLNAATIPARFATYPLTFLMRGMSFAKAAAVPATAASSIKAVGSVLAGGLGSSTRALGSAAGLGVSGPTVSAGLARAVSIGPLSVPQAWAAGVPAGAASHTAAALPGTAMSAAPAGGSAGVPPLMPITSMAGRGVGGATPQYDIRPSVIPRSPAAG